MSQPYNASQPAGLQVADQQVQISDSFRQQFRACMQDFLFSWPDKTVTWITDQVAVRGLAVPIGQVIGFSQTRFQPASIITTQESTGSTAYTDLDTVGPELTGIPDGSYAIFFGADGAGGSNGGYFAVSVNGADPSDDDAVHTASSQFGTSSRLILADLNSGGSNTLKVVYKSGPSIGTDPSWAKRWLIIVKYLNT